MSTLQDSSERNLLIRWIKKSYHQKLAQSAARLEQANKQFDTGILFSRSMYVALPVDLIAHVQEQGTKNLKGRVQ